ncbi:MAG TPA: SpoIIE family protein phosphatase, partial [Candidatus Xenobia bacterium]
GSFCAASHHPHAWDDHELDVLHDLAAAVTTELERHSLLADYRRSLAALQGTAFSEAVLARNKLVSALQHERSIVRKLARSFLGKVPKLAGFQVASVYQPAFETDRVGGDYYDFIRIGRDRLGVVIGDVCGKGLSAAIYTSMAVCMTRYYAREIAEPRQVMERLNAGLHAELSQEACLSPCSSAAWICAPALSPTSMRGTPPRSCSIPLPGRAIVWT